MMMRALVVMFALALLAGSAFAQAELTPKAKAEAESAAGQKLFDDGKFHDAAGHFVHANEIDPQAPYIYNAATAYRLAGDCANAAKYYRSFVDATKGVQVQNLDKVKRYIDDMDACAKSPEPTPPQPPPVVAQPVPTSNPAAPQPSPDPGRTKRRVGVAVGAAGIVGLAVGAYFTSRVISAHNDDQAWLTANCQPPPNMPCDPAALATQQKLDQDRGKRAETGEAIAYGVGGAAVIGGVVLYVLGRGDTGEHPVAVAPTRGGAMVTAGWSF
jgi:hypothetical protein